MSQKELISILITFGGGIRFRCPGNFYAYQFPEYEWVVNWHHLLAGVYNVLPFPTYFLKKDSESHLFNYLGNVVFFP